MTNGGSRPDLAPQDPDFGPDFDTRATGKALVAWYRRQRKPYPWRERFAATGDPYLVWVSEIMLQQTVIKAVLPVYERFLARFPDVGSLAAASDDEVRIAVRGLGYYRRFRMLHAAAKQIAAGGVTWPRTASAWRQLPGVGDYTAAAVASIAFGDPEAVVDGNVERVLARLLDLRQPIGRPALKRRFKALAGRLLDRDAPGDFNQALMELGQTLCSVASPTCEPCPLQAGCLARQRSSTHLAPAARSRPEPVDVHMQLHVVRNARGDIGLLERPAGARFLKGCLGLPTALVAADGSRALDGRRDDSMACPVHDGVVAGVSGTSLGEIKHSITRHRIRAQVLASDDRHWPPGLAWQWTPVAAVEERLLANLDRKAWLLFTTTPSGAFKVRQNSSNNKELTS